jgi:hypothetical protein
VEVLEEYVEVLDSGVEVLEEVEEELVVVEVEIEPPPETGSPSEEQVLMYTVAISGATYEDGLWL